MKQLHGKITDRLLKLLSTGKISNSAIHPGRPADAPAKKGKIPKGVDGQSLGGRHKRGKRS